MKIINKIFIFIYTLLIVFCLMRLAVLEPSHLAQILEIMLAAVTVVKAIHSISIGFLPEDNEVGND